jgi:hypothetical protein
MKTLFRQFVRDIKHEQDENTMMYDDEVVDFSMTDSVKIPAISLFSDIGKLFDKELKQ